MQALRNTIDCIVCSQHEEDGSSNDNLQDHPQYKIVETPRYHAAQLSVKSEMWRMMRTKKKKLKDQKRRHWLRLQLPKQLSKHFCDMRSWQSKIKKNTSVFIKYCFALQVTTS